MCPCASRTLNVPERHGHKGHASLTIEYATTIMRVCIGDIVKTMFPVFVEMCKTSCDVSRFDCFYAKGQSMSKTHRNVPVSKGSSSAKGSSSPQTSVMRRDVPFTSDEINAQIASLLIELGDASKRKDANAQKAIRRKLRARGHRGGRTRTPTTVVSVLSNAQS